MVGGFLAEVQAGCGHAADDGGHTGNALVPDALSIVRERYARGEIDKVTFDRLRQDLA